MTIKARPDWTEMWDEMADPRGAAPALRHPLRDMLLIALCAMLSGADTFVDMERFGRAKQAWLQERLGLDLARGVPSHDTFGRLFARLDPQALTGVLERWTGQLRTLTQGQVIALDGKTLRRSFDTATGTKALHVVSAWAQGERLVLAQQAVGTKSNEITVLPQLLAQLDLTDCVVTVDAMGTQKRIAQQVLDQGGDYIMALKGNHAHLSEDVAAFFHWAQRQPGGLGHTCQGHATSTDWAHGRHEVRRCYCLQVTPEEWPAAVAQWPGLRSLIMIESERTSTVSEDGVPPRRAATVERRYYLSSLACTQPGQADQILQATRSHWGIENSLHWVLDVAFNEDQCRVRKDHGPRNLATLRALSLNLLRQVLDKNGIKARRLRAAWDNTYLLRVLAGAAHA